MGDRQTVRIWDAVLTPIAPPTLGGRRDGERASILCTSKQQSLVSLLAKHRPNDLPNAGNSATTNCPGTPERGCSKRQRKQGSWALRRCCWSPQRLTQRVFRELKSSASLSRWTCFFAKGLGRACPRRPRSWPGPQLTEISPNLPKSNSHAEPG